MLCWHEMCPSRPRQVLGPDVEGLPALLDLMSRDFLPAWPLVGGEAGAEDSDFLPCTLCVPGPAGNGEDFRGGPVVALWGHLTDVVWSTRNSLSSTTASPRSSSQGCRGDLGSYLEVR